MRKKGLVAVVLFVCAMFAGYAIYVSASDNKNKKTKTAASAQEAKQKPAAAAGELVATVNGKPITKAEYDLGVDRFGKQLAASGQDSEEAMKELKSRILDSLITREVLSQQAEKMGIKADDAEVNQQMDAMKAKYGTAENFNKAISAMNLTEPELKKQVATELALRKLVDQEVASKIVIGPNEAKEFYDKNPEFFKIPEMVRASHILVKVDPKATPEEKAKALEKIKDIQKRIKGGADFAQVAKEVSDDPSKANGGDLDFFPRGRMVPAFEKVAFSLQMNQVSDIVETQFGYHLIKLTDKKPAGVMTLDEVKPRIEQHLKNEKVSQEFKKYIEGLKSAAKIQVLVAMPAKTEK